MRRALVMLFWGWVVTLAPLMLVGVAGTGAFAQDASSAPDYVAWEKVAVRAEMALRDRRASNTALEQLRATLAGWRTIFLDAQDSDGARIASLRDQLTSLGPVPEGEGAEPEELAARRGELNAQLAGLEAPRRSAEDAYTRADGLIGETDSIIRARQTARLFELEPSPLNHTIWAEAGRAIGGTLTLARTEIATAWQSQTRQKQFRESLPVTLLYLVAALVLLLRGRSWMVALTRRVQSGPGGPVAQIKGFLVSMAQVLLPVLGIYALVEALFSTGLVGFRGQIIADALPAIGLAFFGARWLALRLLPKTPDQRSFVPIPGAGADRIRRYAGWLGLLWGGDRLLVQLAEFESYSMQSQVVLHFPLIVASGYVLFQLGRVLRQSVRPDGADVDTSFKTRAVDLVGRSLIGIGVAGPLVAAIGYFSAALGFTYPAILTTGVLALLVVLGGLVRNSYAVIVGGDAEAARDALIPMLLNFALALLALPGLALIWGARASDLTEIWRRFVAGVQLGDARVSPTDFLTFAIIFAVGYALTRLVQSTLRTSILPKTRIEPGGRNAIVSGIGYFGIFLAAVIAISTAGIDLSSLAIVAGALSVGIGFGLQTSCPTLCPASSC
jgi:small-conductance mechanosensitive channel